MNKAKYFPSRNKLDNIFWTIGMSTKTVEMKYHRRLHLAKMLISRSNEPTTCTRNIYERQVNCMVAG